MVRNNLNIEIRGLLNNNMRCFEIQVNGKKFIKRWNRLNNNMRCFEIRLLLMFQVHSNRLNNNMRCFEIYTDPLDGEMYVLLNNNMRCFEIGMTLEIPS